MSNKVIKLSEYNRKDKRKYAEFGEYPEEVRTEMIKEKLYEELEEYCEETIQVVEKFKNEFTIFNSTIGLLDNPNIKRDIVHDYVLNMINAFIERKNIFTCDDERYEEIRTDLFKRIEEHYFK